MQKIMQCAEGLWPSPNFYIFSKPSAFGKTFLTTFLTVIHEKQCLPPFYRQPPHFYMKILPLPSSMIFEKPQP